VSELAGQVAVVTGGASGIGRAIAAGLTEAGAVVVVADLAATGPEGARTDVSDAEEVDRLVRDVLERHGRVDVLVNCAGICSVRPFLELTEEDLRRMWEVHALGTFLCSRAVVPAMRERGYGRIVNIVSGPAGYGASPWTAHYQAAKSAQTSLSRSMALALGADGITVNCVSPGLVVTALWDGLDEDYRRTFGHGADEEIARRVADAGSYPLGRAVEPEEVARVVVFLALPASAAITGEVITL
jgi:NAD(P)-dependent dehydrogenase (short-subunit alcohol dehydrogenase family)